MSAAPPRPGNPIPYKMYFSNSAAKEGALLWRLKGASGEEPRAWILVIGTSGEEEFSSNELASVICDIIGRKLSERQLGLITGGGQGVDTAVGRAYAESFNQDDIDSRHYQRTYTSEEMTPNEDFERYSTVFALDTDHIAMQTMTTDCHACIVVGGHERSWKVASICLENGTPVLPVLDSGDVAEGFYFKEIKELDYKRSINIYGEDFKPEELEVNYKDAIDRIMRYLEHRFPAPPSSQVS